MPQKYHHLSLAEREKISRMHAAAVSVCRIAVELGRHPATIYRELRRNFFYDEEPWFRGYFGRTAHSKAASRRVRGGKVMRDRALALHIVDRLAQCWSPEQIAGHLRLDPSGRHRVCHETIYQFVYGSEGRRLGLWHQLPRQRKVRRPRYARKPRGLNIPPANTIAERPKQIGERVEFGHWEGDLIAFRQEFGKANLTSLVERRSRYIVLERNPSRHSRGVMEGIQRHLTPSPQHLRQSITFDRGTEFAAFAMLKASLGMTTYFCKPSAPWQKGSVENSNGRIRRFLPLDADISRMTEAELASLTDRLNNTPRKCLGFRTPAEVFNEQIVAHRSE
ncbi:IS30 family transposase [Croceicoccus marinus]|uniref:IS30 family transposase n=1 Tax=Croceicoccus marinus TaxID=450378 RepID=A0A7G6W182_9SPHN|nr:IS30 family transposase [Croceicoccus marinus]QNE07747.1 IS30 family transposase [Croceicoccus marinus]